jgi:hypothetical protein
MVASGSSINSISLEKIQECKLTALKLGELVIPRYRDYSSFDRASGTERNQIERYLKVFDEFNDYVHFFYGMSTFIRIFGNQLPGIVVDDVCYEIQELTSRIDHEAKNKQYQVGIPLYQKMIGHRFVKVMYTDGLMEYYPDWALKVIGE